MTNYGKSRLYRIRLQNQMLKCIMYTKCFCIHCIQKPIKSLLFDINKQLVYSTYIIIPTYDYSTTQNIIYC